MTTSATPEPVTAVGRPRLPGWFPIVGIAATAGLTHLGGGALIHLGLGAVAADLALNAAAGRSGTVLTLGVAAVVVLMTLTVVGARRQARPGERRS